MKNRGKLQICIYIHELMVSVIVPSCIGKETENIEKWAVSMWSYWFCQHSLGFRLHGMLTDLRTIIVSKRSFCLFNVCPAIRRFNPIKHHSENFITVQENLLRSILIKHLNAIILWKICLFHQPLWLFNNPRTALGIYRCHFVDFRFFAAWGCEFPCCLPTGCLKPGNVTENVPHHYASKFKLIQAFVQHILSLPCRIITKR